MMPYSTTATSATWGGTDLHWSERVLVPPPFEPVTLDQVKQRLRIVSTADDADLELLIKAARRKVEQDTSAVLVGAVIEQTVDQPPYGTATLRLVRWPVLSIRKVTTYDLNDVGTDLATTAYRLDNASRPARLVLTPGSFWPPTRCQNAVAVQFDAGFVIDEDNPEGAAIPVTRLQNSGGITTITTAIANDYAVGDPVRIDGSGSVSYDGQTFPVQAVTSATVFTITSSANPGFPPSSTPPTTTVTKTATTVTKVVTPALLQLAVLALVQHWWDPLRAGLTTDMPDVLPFGYDALIADRLEWLA